MNFIRKNLNQTTLAVYIFGILSLPSVIYALGPCNTAGGTICNPLGAGNNETLPAFIQTLLTGVLKIGIPVVALAIIYCGFLFVAARGKPEALTKAKSALLYTLIGAGVLLGSWAIAEMISNTVLSL